MRGRTPWMEPFRGGWPEPVEDLRRRFDRLPPSFSVREVAAWTGGFLLVMGAVVVGLELLV